MTIRPDIQRALSLYQLGHREQARNLCESAVRAGPACFEGPWLLGLLAGERADYAESERWFTRALLVNDSSAETYRNRGLARRLLQDWQGARADFDKAIELNPVSADAHVSRGNLLRDLRQWDDALRDYDVAIACDARHVQAHYNRGVALADDGRLEEALASYGTAIQVQPTHLLAHLNSGTLLERLGRLEQALASYDRVLALKPDFAPAYANKGNCLCRLERFEEALASCEKAIQLAPELVQAYLNRGAALERLRRFEAALESFDLALALDPGNVQALTNRGAVLAYLDQPEQALAAYEQAIALNPRQADAYFNRAALLRDQNGRQQALEDYQRAIELKGDFAEGYIGLGAIYGDLGRIPEAISSYGRAIELDPTSADAHLHRAMAWLSAGEFERGWQEYEWRWQTKSLRRRRQFSQPLWLGECSIQGKTVLLHAEQGIGDTLQFCRYAPLLRSLDARVLILVPRALKRLMRTLPGTDTVLSEDDPLPVFDFHCPMMSLPLAFQTGLDTVPAGGPYLHSLPEDHRHWQQKLGKRQRPRVGLIWSGGFRANQPELWAANRRRNVPLASLLNALRGIDADFFSLQKGEPAESELASLIAQGLDGPGLHIHTADLRDFSDTAALIDHLDLIVSVDTSTAHLAAAMGRPVWLLNRFDTCWRWLRDRDDSPWYPSLKLYRQPAPGDWGSVLGALRSDLLKLTA